MSAADKVEIAHCANYMEIINYRVRDVLLIKVEIVVRKMILPGEIGIGEIGIIVYSMTIIPPPIKCPFF